MYGPYSIILKKVKCKVPSFQFVNSLSVLLLLAVIVSGVFAVNQSVFAQETQEQEIQEDMVVDESASPESDQAETDDADETQTEDDMETTESEEIYADSPLKQLTSGTDPHAIQCDTGFKLAFKASNSRPACLTESTYQILSQRGWVSSTDPTPEELSAMLSSLPKLAMESEDDTMDDETNTEDDSEDTVEDAEDTSGNATSAQSFKVELQESMDMGVN